jgi:hypothetical protein
MNKTFWNRFLDSCADNRKFKIENPKSVGILGIFAIALTFAMCGVVAEAQQPKKVPRIGFLGATSASANPARNEAFRQGGRTLSLSGDLQRENWIASRLSSPS